MWPWLWIWAPQWQLPLSGDVAQRIEPDTEWFFGAIAPAAGVGSIEKRAFEVASYGRQLGLVTDLLLDLADRLPPEDAAAVEARERLGKIRERIRTIKQEDAAATAVRLRDEADRLRSRDPDAYAALVRALPRPSA